MDDVAARVEISRIGPFTYLENHGPALVKVMNRTTGEVTTLHVGDVLHQTAPLRYWYEDPPTVFDGPLI